MVSAQGRYVNKGGGDVELAVRRNDAALLGVFPYAADAWGVYFSYGGQK